MMGRSMDAVTIRTNAFPRQREALRGHFDSGTAAIAISADMCRARQTPSPWRVVPSGTDAKPCEELMLRVSFNHVKVADIFMACLEATFCRHRHFFHFQVDDLPVDLEEAVAGHVARRPAPVLLHLVEHAA